MKADDTSSANRPFDEGWARKIAEGIAAGGFTRPLPPWCPLRSARMVCRPARSRPYWYGVVYDRVVGRSFMVHLGRQETLTPELLERKAAELAAKLRDWMPAIPRRVKCPRCGR